MKVSLIGLCRDNGKLLIKAIIRKSASDNTISIWSQGSSDLRFPSNCYHIVENSETDRYVIALPAMGIKQKLVVEEINTQHEKVSVQFEEISQFKATWKSRLNRRFRKKLVYEILDYSESFQHKQGTMKFLDCIPDYSCNIIRAKVLVQEHEKVDRLSYACVDSNGEIVAINPILLHTKTLFSDEHASERIQEALVSIRIPKKIMSYCVIFNNLESEESDKHIGSQKQISFCVLEKYQYLELLEQGITRIKSAQDYADFDLMFKHNRTKQKLFEEQSRKIFPINPLFSIVVPLYKTPLDLFCEMVESVRNQSYKNWELVLVQASPSNSEVVSKTEHYLLADNRIKQVMLSTNKGISENTNAGIQITQGDFICFLDHDDLIEPDLLYEYASAINKEESIDLIYCDEDKIDGNGRHFDPSFKPDFNLDLLRNNNYICHLLCIRASLLSEIGLLESQYDGAQDHDLTLRACEKARVIHHVSKLLYHWRASERSAASSTENKAYANTTGIKAVQSHLSRLGIEAKVEQSRRPFTYRITYAIPQEQPLVSIIIPNKDNKEILKNCIDSIITKSTYQNFEILVIENNSISCETFKYYEEPSSFSNLRIINYQGEFNFSKIVNFGLKNTEAEYVILLNNDTEVITEEWIERMLGICSRKDVGVVGAKLYFPDETIQHAGIIITPNVAQYSHLHLPKTNWGYLALNDAEQNVSAVTAACFMTKKSVFGKVGGFDEELAIAYNDIDYCLKVRDLGFLIVYSPEIELYRYDSYSKEDETLKEKKMFLEQEVLFMKNRWSKYYDLGDPYYNKNLSTDGTKARYYGLDWSYPKQLQQRCKDMIYKIAKRARRALY